VVACRRSRLFQENESGEAASHECIRYQRIKSWHAWDGMSEQAIGGMQS
jgi:hypothetical protein